MIKIDYEVCQAANPKRFDEIREFYLRCIEEKDPYDIFKCDSTKRFAVKYISSCKEVSNLEKVLNMLEALTDYKKDPKNNIDYDTSKARKIFEGILDADPQLYVDIVSAMHAMIYSKLTCLKGDLSRHLLSTIADEMRAVLTSEDEDTTPILEENSSLIPDGAEYVEDDDQIMMEGINPTGEIIEGAIDMEDIYSTSEEHLDGMTDEEYKAFVEECEKSEVDPDVREDS